METIIVLAVIAVISNLVNKAKNKPKQNSNQTQESWHDQENLGEPWANSIEVYTQTEQPQSNENQTVNSDASSDTTKPFWLRTELTMEDLKQAAETVASKFGEKNAPVKQGSPKTHGQPTMQPNVQQDYNLCQAHPEVTKSADMKEATLIEEADNKLKEQTQAKGKPGTNNGSAKTIIVIPMAEHGVDLSKIAEKKKLSTLEQGIVFAEILGKPVARKFGA